MAASQKRRGLDAQCLQSLDELLEALKIHSTVVQEGFKRANNTNEQPATTEALATAEGQLRQLAAAVADVVTKFTLAFQGTPKFQHCKPFAEMLERALLTLQAAVQGLHPSVGLTLRTHLKFTMLHLLDAVADLARGFKEQVEDEGVSAHLTGVVWKYCKDFEELILDNKVETKAAIKRHSEIIKDALDELSAIHVAEDTSDEADEDRDEAALSASEFKAVAPVTTLVKCGLALSQKAIQRVSAVDNAKTTESVVIGWFDRLAANADSVAAAVDSAIISLYAPQNAANVQSTASQLRAACEEIITALRREGLPDAAVLSDAAKEASDQTWLSLVADKLRAAEIALARVLAER